jgi:hypothetical protein
VCWLRDSVHDVHLAFTVEADPGQGFTSSLASGGRFGP